MSGQASGWVMRHGPCTTWATRHGVKKDRTAQAVLLAIADATNRDGEAGHPGMPAMIDASGYARATVFAALDRLQKLGYIVITEDGHGRGRATVYMIPGVTLDGWTPTPEKVQQPDVSGDLKGPDENAKRSSPQREKVQISDPALCTSTVSNGSTNGATELPLGPDMAAPVKPAKKVAGHAIVQAVWKARTDAGEPVPVMNPGAAVNLAEKFVAAGHEPEAIIAAMLSAQTISVGWIESELRKRRARPRQVGARATFDESDRDQPEGRIYL